MKGYTKFIAVFVLVLALYIVAEVNRPRQINWNITLENKDKNPYGAFILYDQLAGLFPGASIQSFRRPVYNQLNHFKGKNTAYLLIAPELDFSREDVNSMLAFVAAGNYVFMASGAFGKRLMDTLHFKTKRRFDAAGNDSTTIRLTNPALHPGSKFGFRRMTIDAYLDPLDTVQSVVLGVNQRNDVNFIQVRRGAGSFFVHALPVCFSNYFMLTKKNADYTTAALSYLPRQVGTVFWDEYYKVGMEGSQSPLRFVLGNHWLAWAFRLALLTIVLFVLFEMKRTQRVIPQITPLVNSTLEFAKTVGNVYFNKKDNKNIAQKKVVYFMDWIRANLFIFTNPSDQAFIPELSAKTSVDKEEIADLVGLMRQVQDHAQVEDDVLLALNKAIDRFYEQAG